MATLAVSGKPVLHSGVTTDPPAVWVDVANADNKVQADHLAVDRPVRQSRHAYHSAGRQDGHAPHPRPVRIGARVPSLATTPRCACSWVSASFRASPSSSILVTGGVTLALSAASGLMEKDVTLDVAQRLGKLLEAAGAKVLYTRCDDTLPGSSRARAEGGRSQRATLHPLRDRQRCPRRSVRCDSLQRPRQRPRRKYAAPRPTTDAPRVHSLRAGHATGNGARLRPYRTAAPSTTRNPSSSSAIPKCPPCWSNSPT